MTDDEQKPPRDFALLGDILGGLFAPEMLPDFGREEAPQTAPSKVSKARPVKAELVKSAATIAARPNDAELAYQARSMMQCTLPHRNPGEVPIWARRNGDLTLMLQPGYDDKTLKSLGFPFGEIPRLLLIWIVTEAVRTKSPHIKLDDELSTLSGFLRALGLDPNTGRGKRGDAKRIKDQMIRLFSCRISFKRSEGSAENGSLALLNMEVASAAQLWWDFRNPEQGGLFKSEIVLGDNFFKAITLRPVPLDLRAVIALKKNLHQSSFAIDVYLWVTWRIFTMQDKAQKEIRIPLALLKEQFGAEYKRLRDFKAAFDEALGHVRAVFPAFDYRFESGVFILCDNQGGRAVLSRTKTATQRRLERPHREISAKTRQWFAENYGGWTLETALKDFNQWLENSRIEPRSINALFRDFIRNHWAK